VKAHQAEHRDDVSRDGCLPQRVLRVAPLPAVGPGAGGCDNGCASLSSTSASPLQSTRSLTSARRGLGTMGSGLPLSGKCNTWTLWLSSEVFE
jgi:hypothetical protein